MSAIALVVVLGTGGIVRIARADAGRDPAVVLDVAGSGSRRTPRFRLPDQWTLKWSFDCVSSTSGPGVFSVEVVRAGSPPEYDPQIPRLVRFDTAGSGLERYDRGGYRAFLRVASQCRWTLKATRFGA